MDDRTKPHMWPVDSSGSMKLASQVFDTTKVDARRLRVCGQYDIFTPLLWLLGTSTCVGVRTRPLLWVGGTLASCSLVDVLTPHEWVVGDSACAELTLF